MLYLVKIDSVQCKYTASPYHGEVTPQDGTDFVILPVVEPGVTCMVVQESYLETCQKSLSMSWAGKYDTVEVPLEMVDA